jgi:hypothetical protein
MPREDYLRFCAWLPQAAPRYVLPVARTIRALYARGSRFATVYSHIDESGGPYPIRRRFS